MALARALVRRGTVEGAEAAGRRLGRLYRVFDRRRRDLAEENLALAFPEKSAAEVERLSIAVFEHFGGLAAELVRALDETNDELLSRIAIE